MPAKNIVKTYVKDGYYHVYNRGVEKRIIFEEEQDYNVFLNYLKTSLSKPPDPETLAVKFTLKGDTFKGIPRQPKNFRKKIKLIAYCLMPNHFHILLQQHEEGAMANLMQSILTRYSMYFNKKYKRVGKLFQGAYKAVLVDNDAYLLHLSRYIHRNPAEYAEYADNLKKAYSSYSCYLEPKQKSWVNPNIVLDFFSSPALEGILNVNSYQSFVENQEIDSKETLGNLTLEG